MSQSDPSSPTSPADSTFWHQLSGRLRLDRWNLLHDVVAATLLAVIAAGAWPLFTRHILPIIADDTDALHTWLVDFPRTLCGDSYLGRFAFMTSVLSLLIAGGRAIFACARHLFIKKSGRYRRHLHHLRPARWHLLGGVFAALVFAICTGAGLPVAMKYLLPIFFHQQDKIDPKVLGLARRLFGDAYLDRLLLLACVGLPLVFVLRGLAAIANRYLINKAGFIALENIRLEVYDRLLNLPIAFHHRNKAGDLQARLMGDTDKLKVVVVNVGGEIIKQPFTLVFAIGALLYFCITERSALFALIAMLSVPLCIIPIRLAARQLVKRARQLAEKSGQLGSITVETLQSPLEIQAYNLQNRQRLRFSENIREIFALSMKTVKYQSVVTPAIEVVSVCGFVGALYFGTRSGMTFETFSALAVALYMSYEPVKKLSGLHAIIKTGEASLERLEYVLDAEDTVPAPASPRPFPTGPLDVEVDRVSFTYPARVGEKNDAISPALSHISLRIAPGETVALVGKSGMGKSTFIALLPRFYDPGAGSIMIGGIDLRDLDKKALREHIAIVPQGPTLFNTTFAENIRLGRPRATDAEVAEAARRAHIHDFIASQPQGYATQVGERGNSLSGGQRQRIAIARAFLKDAPILILDEATSALDSESESKIQDALRELVKGRTTFMIAHRFSSIRHATRILVFDHGHIAADGTHDALHLSSPIYRELYNHQMLGAQTTA